ncbi:uncharacterized protein HMPREF1541_07618 [Cyphellophora europaea CBS 101466]|uniref:Major facilitator superfamily (MFS) profile domain-containing protein n=1 Tax=Cyphellophora europaea (strain CBS 101466) TaxID=1220924 RepID=W2RNU2_CYPE1|nr:uncharacterized protein HMPREF1541_07618 [Cyphellophora europaea CBS 101466]ETN37995.1 hypothetical protein HMPREF1541_07618 [Cyphellophora europaea CBS 101466]
MSASVIPEVAVLEETASTYEMTTSASDSSDIESVRSEQDTLLAGDDETHADSEESCKESIYRSTLIKVYVAVFVANAAFHILAPAQTAIMEQAICLRWYDEHNPNQIPDSRVIPESQCKTRPIQSELASLRGWYETFDAAPALLTCIPLGILMDIVGRRPLLLAGLCTITAQQFWIALVCLSTDKVPIQLIWLAPVLNFISGGMKVMQMVFICLITDITSRGRLAPALFRLAAIAQLTRVLGPVVAGGLMQMNAWWAIIAGLAGLLAMVGIAWTVPETMDLSAMEQVEAMGTSPATTWQRAWPRIKSGFRELKIVWTDTRLIGLVCLYPFLMVGVTSSEVLQQYISNRYNWTLANAAFIFSLQGVAATVSLFALLPLFSDFIESHFTLGPISLNVIMGRISTFLAAMSYVVVGLAPNVGVLIVGLFLETLGLGGGSALKALAASLVEQKDTGRVFSVVAIFEVLSVMMAYPTTAALFNVGLDKGGGMWLGLPYFLAAVTMAVAGFILLLLRFERAPKLS